MVTKYPEKSIKQKEIEPKEIPKNRPKGPKMNLIHPYTLTTPKIHPKYTQNTPEIHQKYTRNTPEKHPKKHKINSKIFLKTPKIHPKSTLKPHKYVYSKYSKKNTPNPPKNPQKTPKIYQKYTQNTPKIHQKTPKIHQKNTKKNTKKTPKIILIFYVPGTPVPSANAKNNSTNISRTNWPQVRPLYAAFCKKPNSSPTNLCNWFATKKLGIWQKLKSFSKKISAI